MNSFFYFSDLIDFYFKGLTDLRVKKGTNAFIFFKRIEQDIFLNLKKYT